MCVCTCICVANHIKELRSGSVVMTSDPGMLRDRGRVAEEEEKKKDTVERTHTHTLTHKEKGGIHTLQPLNLQQLKKQPRIET